MSEHRSAGTFEDDVTAALRTLPPDDLAAAGLARRVPVLARRRRRRRAAAVLAAAAVAAVLGVVGVTAVGGGDARLLQPAVPTDSPTDQPTDRPASPPPPVDTSQPYIWFGSRAVEPGRQVSLVVVNPLDTPFELYGVAGTVDRWTASGWKRVGVFAAGAGDVPTGRVYVDAAAGQLQAVPAIGFGAPAHGGGERETVAFTDVPPGWYRLGHDETPPAGTSDPARVAYGVIEVREGASSTEPDRSRGGPAALYGPTTVRAGKPTSSFAVQVLGPSAADFDQLDRTVGKVDPDLRVQRWDGATWVDVPSLSARLRPHEPGPYAFLADLPALDAGDYRLVGSASVAGTFYGYVTAVPM